MYLTLTLEHSQGHTRHHKIHFWGAKHHTWWGWILKVYSGKERKEKKEESNFCFFRAIIIRSFYLSPL